MEDISRGPDPPSSIRAPLLWLVLPQILGYQAGLHLQVAPWVCAIGGLALSADALRRCGIRKSWCFPWGTCVFGATLLYSWGWYQVRDPMIRNLELLNLPPRAVEFTIQVRRVFQQSDEHGRVSGIGQVLEAPEVQEYLTGTDLYFRTYKNKVKAPFVRGDELRLKGIVQPVGWGQEEVANFENFLKRAHIFHECKRAIIDERIRPANGFLQFCHRTNLFFQKTLRDGAEPGEDSRADVLVAMLLGEKTALTTEQKEDFRHSGTMHLFAISGLHVGVVALVVAWILGLIPVPGWTRVVLGLGVLFLYVEITGGQPSAIRAFLMVSFLWGSRIIMRRSNPFPALVGSAVFILIADPAQIRNLGFQFSYAVVSVILLYGLPLADQLKAWTAPRFIGVPEMSVPLWRRFLETVKLWFLLVFSISLSATMASTPLTIANFGIATPGTVLLNLFLVTMAGIAIQLGTASLLSGIVSLIILSTGFNFLAKALVGMMAWLVGSALSIPGFFREAEMRHALLGPAGILLMIGVLLACHHWRPRLRWHFFWIPPASFASYLAMTVVPA